METLTILKPTWRWQYCNQSGWSFQIGQPHLKTRKATNHYCDSPSRIDNTGVHGEMSVHVFYSKWWIAGSDWVETRFDDSHDRIDLCMARMNGINIISIDLHKDGWIQKMRFDADIYVTCEPYPDSECDDIANLIYKDDQHAGSSEPPARPASH